ncbi:hypothetical protein F5Y17DRAFT_206859 [Xylariaceae sp. FL0594]|nr:hypothetical protein F5Y17DRAFT_206859 [Xylariaceae sp. FL0594]
MAHSITTNEAFVDILERECGKFTDQYFPLHKKQVASLKAATALVNADKSSIRKNPGKSRAATIFTDLWTHAKEAYVLCALATTQTSLGALKTIDYIKPVQTWWQERPIKPRGLSEIIHLHSDILPTTRLPDFFTVPTTVAQLADLMQSESGGRPLFITCPFGGTPLPYIQIGQEPRVKVELSMEACAKLMRAENGEL